MTLRLAWLLLLTLTGCAPPPTSGCATAQTLMISQTLYFGTESPQGPVARSAWEAFLGDTVTPRFPEGFSWWTSHGQWRNARGQVVQEESYVLSVIHGGDQRAKERAIDEVTTLYKARFHQESVLRSRMAACVSF